MMNSCTKFVEEFFIVSTSGASSQSVNYIRSLTSIKQPTPRGRGTRIIPFLLRQEIRNHVTMDICEAIVSPLIPVCQPIMIDSQMILNCPPGIDKTTNTKGQTKTDDPVSITTRDP
jgi:hypothetical protein